MRDHKKSILQTLIWLFPVLFLIDDVLGVNGYQFTIAGISIRIILFSISVAVLCLYSLVVCRQEKITLLPRKADTVSIFSVLKPIDYLVLFFIAGNFLWATVIPLLVRGNMQYALKDFSTILVLVLYFPVMFLIRTGRLKLPKLEKIFYVLTILLAVWHCVMYVGDTVSEGFYSSYYDFIDWISFGTAVRTDVVYGAGITRIIQVTSLFLIPGIFLSIRYILRGRYWNVLPLILFTFAVCATFTKSIWFGYVAGLLVYLIPMAVQWKDKLLRKRSAVVLAVAVLAIVVLNFTVFGNMVFTRATNTVGTADKADKLLAEFESMKDAYLHQQEAENTDPTDPDPTDPDSTEPEDTEPEEIRPTITHQELVDKQKEYLDAKGTQISNDLRAQQNNALLSKWREGKWLGFGYGSYAESCIRNEQYPFMYESTLPALMMKLGLAGCMVWVIFILGTTVAACLFFWKRDRGDILWWLATALAYAMAVQTNPFLFTFSGFSILLYLLIVMQDKTDIHRR